MVEGLIVGEFVCFTCVAFVLGWGLLLIWGLALAILVVVFSLCGVLLRVFSSAFA